MKAHIGFYCCLTLLGGCVSFTAVPPGESKYADLSVISANTWNRAPRELAGPARPDAATWTRNGMLLDRILIIPAVPGGEPIFRQTSKSQAFPLFDPGMLPNEIEELTESSIAKLFGEGNAAVETGKLRPHRFGKTRGMMFDLDVSVSEGPNYKGVVGAMIVDEKLYLIVYLGAEPYYYDTYLDEAIRLIESARIGAREANATTPDPPVQSTALPVNDLSGHYISDITTNSNWQLRKKYHALQIKVDQQGNEITAFDNKYGTRITGRLEGDVIRFQVEANVVTGFYDVEGEWRFDPANQVLVGTWTSRSGPDAGSGRWNLIRVK